MKKLIPLILIVFLIATTLVGCGGTPANNTADKPQPQAQTIEPVTIKLAYNLPSSHFIPIGIEDFAKKVGEKSEGKIKIETYPAGQLYSDKEMNEAILAGNVEMGVNSTSMWATIVPAMAIFDVPFLFPNYEVAGKALKGELGKTLSDAMEQKGVKVVMWMDYGYGQFASNVKPLKSPDDFKGLKIRGYGDIISDTIKSFGGAPVFMGAGEVYMGLQRGTIEGATSGATAMESRKIYEVAKYLTINNAFFPEFPLVVNASFWNSLPEPTKQLIQEVASETEDWIREEASKADLESIKALEEKGMEVYIVPENELKIWKDAAQPTWELFKKNSGELGAKALQTVENIK